MKKSKDITNILIVGGGKGGNALLELFIKDYTINVIGLVDINPDAIGVLNAQQKGVSTAFSVEEFMDKDDLHLDIIIDVTGNAGIFKALKNSAPPHVTIINNKAAKFIWNLIEVNQDNILLKNQNKSLREWISEDKGDDIIYGKNPLMLQVKEMVKQVAPIEANVLILGESGTGKELIAAAIHNLSNLKNELYLKINCTSFSTELLERELFGYVKGAFEGATQDYKGLLERADGGTVFMDEIGDVDLSLQAKILRFIQFGEVEPIGATKIMTVNTRLITATNKNLEVLTQEKIFRKDLFFRLNNYTINIPPLRLRKEDIPILAYLFLNKSVATLNKSILSISTSAMDSLYDYDYPGNIRELQSIVERAVILCDENTLRPKHLSLSANQLNHDNKHKLDNSGLSDAKESVIEQFEREAIAHYLTKAKGNVTTAAGLAKTPKRSFYRMLEKYQMDNAKYKIK